MGYSTGSESFRGTDDECEGINLTYDIEFESEFFSACYVSIYHRFSAFFPGSLVWLFKNNLT